MGQEIDSFRFSQDDFIRFSERLREETELLSDLASQEKLSERGPVAGFELEAWLIDRTLNPAAINAEFLERMGPPLAFPELAQFNVELNNQPRPLRGKVLYLIEDELTANWSRGCQIAERLGLSLLSIGILPTVTDTWLNPVYMSPLKRYRALNEQVLRSRQNRPLQLNIVGRQHLSSEHNNVMLEAATTSYQIHLQTPLHLATQFYNAAIIASAPMIAAGANSPYLFDHDLWDETRIPLFEQAVEIGGFNGVAQGPLHRVSFGSGYVRDSIIECFEENLQHFPVLLPTLFDSKSGQFSHLRLHNGTIWRWNRPLLGFDGDGTPHVRVEHRILPGSTSIKDAVANAALFYGLAEGLRMDQKDLSKRLAFSQAKDNFYQAARYGLDAQVIWLDQKRFKIQHLLLNDLLPLAKRGLTHLGIDNNSADHYLSIINERVQLKQNGCNWQRRFVEKHSSDRYALTAAYLDRQRNGNPVHEWKL